MLVLPQLTDAHRRLAKLAGRWIGDERFPSRTNPGVGGARGTVVARLECDGFFLVSDYIEERDGQVIYRGHGVHSWDAREKCFTMHWFDSLGEVTMAPARGVWEENRLELTQRTAIGLCRYVYDFEGPARYRFRIEHLLEDGYWETFLEATYSREGTSSEERAELAER